MTGNFKTTPVGGREVGFRSSLSVFTNSFFLFFFKLCSALLRINKQMENTHFAENCITGMLLRHVPLYVWSVVENIGQIILIN